MKFCTYVHVGDVIFYNRTSKEFKRRWRLSLTELLQFQLPQKLALFKYGNVTFLNAVIEDLTNCDLQKKDRLSYFYEELVKIKFEDTIKKFKLTEDIIIKTEQQECALLDDIVISYSSKSSNPIRMKISTYANAIGTDVVACICLTLVFILLIQIL